MGSGGRNFYGGAMDMEVTDPTGRMTAMVGYSEIFGRGWWFHPCERGMGRPRF
jgi:hypothetical protein